MLFSVSQSVTASTVRANVKLYGGAHRVSEQPEPEPNPDQPRLTDGELYAGMYPERAKLIRDNGGMPDLKFPHSFCPPSDEVIEELLTSQSPRILALDEVE